jgi:hypothetical protein
MPPPARTHTATSARRTARRAARLLGALACLTMVAACPTAVHAATAAGSTLTLNLAGGDLQLRVDSITALPAGDGSLRVDAILEVDDETGSGDGWVITEDGPPQGVEVLQTRVGCLGESGCPLARPAVPTIGDSGHLLFAAQRNTGMGPQRVEVVVETASAVQGQWSLSIAPRV